MKFAQLLVLAIALASGLAHAQMPRRQPTPLVPWWSVIWAEIWSRSAS